VEQRRVRRMSWMPAAGYKRSASNCRTLATPALQKRKGHSPYWPLRRSGLGSTYRSRTRAVDACLYGRLTRRIHHSRQRQGDASRRESLIDEEPTSVANLSRLWPLALAVGGGLILARIEYGSMPEPSFYEMAAQVIPVLIVAIAVESRAHAFWGRISNVYNAQIVLFLAVGELSAIIAASGVIADELSETEAMVGPTPALTQVMLAATVIGLTAGFFSVLVLAFRGATSKDKHAAL